MNTCSCGRRLYSSDLRPKTDLCQLCWEAANPRPCIEGCGNHSSWRSKNGRCRSCSAKRQAQYRADNAFKRAQESKRALNARIRDFTVLADEQAREDARIGSSVLANAIRLSGHVEAEQTREPLSFEQQLALVQSGRARVVPKVAIPSRTSTHSAVGNSSAMMLGG